MCYFYDDGTHCKTVIDGEIVNAHWGVTKAGKPRKRLAIACITCREKKIKCDPDYPRCVQCEKFGRICKFKNAYVLSKSELTTFARIVANEFLCPRLSY
jgi:Fungal Zn(2)-Cys(6) binuclear cluster domain